MTDERYASDVTVDGVEPGAAAGPAAGARGFGARLAEEREQRALSQSDVARFLNLRVAVIVAIEDEDFAALPQMAFVRGYTRTYARLLDIDEDEIAAALASWRDPSEDDRLPLSPASVAPRRGLGRSLHGHAGLILTLLSILVAVGVAVMLWMIWPEGGFTSSDADTGSTVEDRVLEPATPPGTAISAPSAEPPLRGDDDDSVAPSVGEVEAAGEEDAPRVGGDGNENAESAEASAQPLRPGSGPQSAAAAPVAEAEMADAARPAEFSVRQETAEDGRLLRVFAGGEDRLQMSFSGDCWVELRDAEGRGVVSDLAREGQTLEVYGQGPFQLLLGYAHGVELAYNGEKVALTPHIRNDIASLVVGR